ncbi:tRNA-(ms[2]io[6]A)-hydroxylase [Larsenimonas salina]|uniref:tRNA-(ms[2]io[6]A)-hydroxylase n=1 Tax=Larsenimonas salina TaxID=1295565 RepID=UPI0020739CBE|nr:tRNA-(ms[2]io[6]A)-hydroxylase [Larsenimonas salina]MCM5703780.1 tRNA-(ms[2]io[6]A)-hydroxylase [Larsenimonas salina]
MVSDQVPKVLLDFLPCRTPAAWIEAAAMHNEILLIDHAQCEKKAASTAMHLLFRYVEKPGLLSKMSQLAREELLHFEQVVGLMAARGIDYSHLSASRYAEGLRAHVRKNEPGRLIDILIVGAFIEARSCERFASLIPHLDDELARYYRTLLKSEARHFEDYLGLARDYAGPDDNVDERIAAFREHERELIESTDTHFRFHSGVLT